LNSAGSRWPLTRNTTTSEAAGLLTAPQVTAMTKTSLNKTALKEGFHSAKLVHGFTIQK
jgi:hypothetical protein